MRRTKRYQTKNGAFTCGRKITVRGLMLHSYGVPQPDPNVLAERWDNPCANASVHAHIGRDEVLITLPCGEENGRAARGWHAGTGTTGGSANDTHISAEMTEPSTIKYVGGSRWIELGDGSNTKAHVLATYKNAVMQFAEWCDFYGLNPLADGVIISHSEGYKRGIASNHGDVEHIWKYFGLTMAQFCRDVKAAMQGAGIDFGSNVVITDTSGQKINPLQGTVTVIYPGADGLNIRKAPDYNANVIQVASKGRIFTVTGISADEKWYRLQDGGFLSAVPAYVTFRATPEQKESTAGTGYYRVRESWDKPDTQIGAFKAQENAIDLCKQNFGYKVFDQNGKEIYPCPSVQEAPIRAQVKISNLRIRKGPGTTYDYHKQGGKAIYTGKGIFTIIKTADGHGAELWGLLKAYETQENGWIPMDKEYVQVL